MQTSTGELQQPTLPLGRPNTSVAVLVEPKDVFVACGISIEELSVGGELKDFLIGRDPPMFILRDHDIIDSFVVHLAEVANVVITLIEDIGSVESTNNDVSSCRSQAGDVVAAKEVGVSGIIAEDCHLASVVATDASALHGIP